MTRTRNLARTCAVAFATAFLEFSGLATPAHAQLGLTFVGVGEFDTSDVYLILGGVSASPRRSGWSPVFGLQAYWLQYPLGGTNVTAVQPSMGLKDLFQGGSFQVGVGNSFTSKDDEGSRPVVNADVSGDGVTNHVMLDYWGNGAWAAQALASYNYGSSSFLGRGRLLKRLFDVGSGGLSLGGEVAHLNGDSYTATKVGGVASLNSGPVTTLHLAIGRKLPNAGDNATYFAFEIVLYPH